MVTGLRAGWGRAVLCAAAAAVAAFVPQHAGLDPAGRRTLFILVLAAGLWVTEAMPAFAVGLLVIALEIALLGRPDGVFARSPDDWEMFVRPWGSPVIWLFFGGFVLAAAAERTGLDRRLASLFVARVGNRAPLLLLAAMATTFVLSMFLSNTAATALVLAVLAPVTSRVVPGLAKALLLGVPVAAGLGGMATIIGSPPNAIAAGALAVRDPVDFLEWMIAGLPPAALAAAAAWLFLLKRHRVPPTFDPAPLTQDTTRDTDAPRWQRALTVAVFSATILLWITSPWTGLPTPAVSFLPIAVFTTAGVLGAKQIRTLPWDVLLLLAGGLALGVAVSETGLAAWLVARLPAAGLGPVALALLVAYGAAAVSNFMSNTAAANMLVPIVLALGGEAPAELVVPVVLAMSSGMCLPVSTPPNAIAFSSGLLGARDFLPGGLFVLLVAPPAAVLWCRLVL